MTNFPPFEIPKEPQLKWRLWDPFFEHHATALGYLCHHYARLELTINIIIQRQLRCSNKERDILSDGFGTSIDNRCNIALKLASMSKPDQIWFEDLEDLLGRVKRDLAPHRNRLIHDTWIHGGENNMGQIDLRTFLEKPQSRKSKTLTPPKQLKRDLDDIWKLVHDTKHIGFALSNLDTQYLIWKEQGLLLEYLSPPLWVCKGTSQPNDPSPPTRRAPKPPPQSSEK